MTGILQLNMGAWSSGSSPGSKPEGRWFEPPCRYQTKQARCRRRRAFRVSKEKKMTIDTYSVTDDRELERLDASQDDAQADALFHALRAQAADDLDGAADSPRHDLLAGQDGTLDAVQAYL